MRQYKAGLCCFLGNMTFHLHEDHFKSFTLPKYPNLSSGFSSSADALITDFAS